MPDTTNTLLLIVIVLLAGVLLAFAGILRRSAPNRRFDRTSPTPATSHSAEPPAQVAESILQRLTPRERDVALLAARGLRNRQIAAELGLSVNTISNHLKRVYAKLGVRSRAELSWRLQYLDLHAGAPPDVLD